MYEKDTEKLLTEIKTDKIKNFLAENQNEMIESLHVYLNKLLEEKKLNKAEVIKNSLINVNYGYHIFEGKKNNPSRNKIIALGIAMKLNLQEIQYLLRYSGNGNLYPRNGRDAVIISAIEQKLSVTDTNLLLESFGEKILA